MFWQNEHPAMAALRIPLRNAAKEKQVACRHVMHCLGKHGAVRASCGLFRLMPRVQCTMSQGIECALVA